MILGEDLLLAYGAKYQTYAANQKIFSEGNNPKFYFQIVKGVVELNNYHFDGREFIQNILTTGQSLGESLLFNDHSYPMNAIAKTECQLLKISKVDFLNLLVRNPEVSSNVFSCMSEKLYNNYLMMFGMSSFDPLIKVKTVLDAFKGSQSDKSVTFLIPLTRQQLANLTGLRVETVIRTVKKMEKENLLKIKNGKILY